MRRPGHIKRLVYRLGFRPRLGNPLHSPSLEMQYLFQEHWGVSGNVSVRNEPGSVIALVDGNGDIRARLVLTTIVHARDGVHAEFRSFEQYVKDGRIQP